MGEVPFFAETEGGWGGGVRLKIRSGTFRMRRKETEAEKKGVKRHLFP